MLSLPMASASLRWDPHLRDRRLALVPKSVEPPRGLDAHDYEGSRLDGRHRSRQEVVFDERQRLDALGRGQFLDESCQQFPDAHHASFSVATGRSTLCSLCGSFQSGRR